MSKVLANYRNGNCTVTLLADGTKSIEFTPPAKPDFPLSIDLKITDQCDEQCPWCHESSHSKGKHADVFLIMDRLKSLPKGTELAIGGGNPFLYPQLHRLLYSLSRAGLIVNMTVNAAHLRDHQEDILAFRKEKFIYGLGVSWNKDFAAEVNWVRDNNTVVHVIVGITPLQEVKELVRRHHKVLILGYKRYGRGMKYAGAPESCMAEWREAAPALLRVGTVLAFDTLALQQLEVRSLIPPQLWEEHFMGDDGRFTMYVDAVAWAYGRSSTSERHPLGALSLWSAFAAVRQEAESLPKNAGPRQQATAPIGE